MPNGEDDAENLPSIEEQLEQQLQAIRGEETPDSLLKLARELQTILKCRAEAGPKD
ncbi:hypothetical protein [Pseudoroseicyclus tamaricis]|uniref:Uncharacterized protein n=1 Tax=Pseudoroseicyclus tamaricis TaxID=2705421 RepID=A0A6B2K0E7_9RHOB|nr:hypothetical protein [Pseudoroseicyclus tamaricis]NDU99785.1 hypothetical protein [Pseudoroseicyclus tamaricis]